MTDLLDMFDEGGLYENEEKGADKYMDSQRPSDYTAEVLSYEIGTIQNDNNPNNGDSFFAAELRVVEGQAPLSRKTGAKQYEAVDGRPGDTFKIFVPMSKDTKSKMKYRFQQIREFVATLEGISPDDYVAGNTPGPQGLREAINNATGVGAVVRISGQTGNKAGYFNTKLELVPADEPAASTAKGKKATKAA